MAKRFIDTEIFNDPWFMDLTPNEKLFFVYIITNCNHAGIIKFNWKLAEFQTGIKGLANGYETVIKGFGDKLKKLRDEYYWMPKFLEHQYPNFPNSKVRAQDSAIKILLSFGITSYNKLTLSKPLVKGYGSGYDTGKKRGESEGRLNLSQKEVEEYFKEHGKYPNQ